MTHKVPGFVGAASSRDKKMIAAGSRSYLSLHPRANLTFSFRQKTATAQGPRPHMRPRRERKPGDFNTRFRKLPLDLRSNTLAHPLFVVGKLQQNG